MISNIKRRALHRSKILQGQLKGLERMIEKEEYCINLLTQSLAIQKSLRSLSKLILENHLKTHLPEKLESKNAKTQKQAVDELLKIYELSSVRG